MQAAPRDRMRIAVVSMGIAGLAGLGVLASELFVARAQRDAALEEVGASSNERRASGRDRDARNDGTDARGEASFLDVTRSFEASALLAPPDAEFRSRIEQQGRALFWGLVRAPDGTPCADATVFHGGKEVARSDRDGAWRIEVPHDVAIAFGRQAASKDSPALLAARKEGVGFACVDLLGPSRRIDLTLARGKRLRGECLERGSRRPVPRARLTFLGVPSLDHEPVIALSLEAQADELGRFSIGDVPAGAFELRGETEHQDTGSFEPFNFPGDRDREYYLYFDPKLTIQGWFEPWPPWCPSRDGSMAAPRVVAIPTRSHDRGLDRREFGCDVGPDGRFSFSLPSSVRFDVRLEVGAGSLWWTTCELDYGPHDFDFGRIELWPRAWVRGSVAFSSEILDLGVIVNVGSVRLLADSKGRFGPLPVAPGAVSIRVDRLAIEPDGFYWGHREVDATVAAGEELDLGELELQSQVRVLAGRVTDDEGTPVAWACLAMDDPASEYWLSFDTSGPDGRFGVEVPGRPRLDDDGNLEFPSDGPRHVQVNARGFTPQVFALELPQRPGFHRRDLRLSRTAPFRAKLLDESGRPLAGWQVRFRDVAVTERLASAGPQHRRAPLGALSDAWQITDDQGELTIFGLPKTRMQAVASGGDRYGVDLGIVDASKRDVVLTVPKEH